MVTVLEHAGVSDPGPVHQGNEDRWLALPKQGLFLVADGMADQVAPQLAVDLLPGLLAQHLEGVPDLADPGAADAIRETLDELNTRVRQEGRRNDTSGAGATVVLALVRGRLVLIAHLGDSRASLWRAGRLKQLTRDHTRVRRLLDCGQITAEDAARFPSGGGMVQYLGMTGTPAPDTLVLELRPGDRLLLCSDGLHGVLPHTELAAILGNPGPTDDGCQGPFSRSSLFVGRLDKLDFEEGTPVDEERWPLRKVRAFGRRHCLDRTPPGKHHVHPRDQAEAVCRPGTAGVGGEGPRPQAPGRRMAGVPGFRKERQKETPRLSRSRAGSRSAYSSRA